MIPLGSTGTRANQDLKRVPDFSRSFIFNDKEYYLDFWELKRIKGDIDWWSMEAKNFARNDVYNHIKQLHDTAYGILHEKSSLQKKVISVLICGIWFTVLEWDISRITTKGTY